MLKNLRHVHYVPFQIWNSNVLIDDYIAEARIKDHGTEDGETKKYELFGKGKQKDQIMPGTLNVECVKGRHILTTVLFLPWTNNEKY
ncbi:hypothetical protein CHS0354_003460 [Potamilus streckersoni]|uniref:Uncharacterized protein n=1 Tax=Potamilus streckersoni TaxID=2493646 RepID=A0AAE0W004_9BIVA|nr:hypothetical protein CHS0354_003460 [Potamilus streckersoni]